MEKMHTIMTMRSYCILSMLLLACAAAKLQYFSVCNDNTCRWNGAGFYSGWLPDDVRSLNFDYFDARAVMDLTHTSVQVVYIDYAPSCESINIKSNRAVTVYIEDIKCVKPSTADASPRTITHPSTADASPRTITHQGDSASRPQSSTHDFLPTSTHVRRSSTTDASPTPVLNPELTTPPSVDDGSNSNLSLSTILISKYIYL
ncbi:uncharacterized protein LOC134258463 [Saccostrea cucullata]|uniref:uncharacterized protein LOC134258463 n=1 Tax=Saccostrea cuccullata TaxID=36930 RepID=UPI002ED6AD56